MESYKIRIQILDCEENVITTTTTTTDKLAYAGTFMDVDPLYEIVNNLITSAKENENE